MLDNILISIEGNIGVGKSTFIDILQKNIDNSDFVDEPIDIWLNIKDDKGLNILQAFYDDKTRWSYTFQNLAYVSRMQSIEEKIRSSNKKFIFLDRSLDTDKNIFAKMLQEDGFINNLEIEIYNYWCNFYNKFIRPSNKRNIIYLRSSPDIAYNRIIKRNRTEELKISQEYINKLHEYHEKWLFNNTTDNVLILDCNKDFENDLNHQQELLEQVIKFIKN